MTTLPTVNVVEYTAGTILSLVAFSPDSKGNKDAEEYFMTVAKENGMSEDDMFDCLADGLYEQGDYQIFIVHSTIPNL